MYWLDFKQPENQTPERAVAMALDAILDVYKAFGAPGNYGYGTPKGEALRNLYEAHGLLWRTHKEATADDRRAAQAHQEGND